MNPVFAGTFYWIAVTNLLDAAHGRANEVMNDIVTTEEVLTEYLNYFCTGPAHLRRKSSLVAETVFDDPSVRLGDAAHAVAVVRHERPGRIGDARNAARLVIGGDGAEGACTGDGAVHIGHIAAFVIGEAEAADLVRRAGQASDAEAVTGRLVVGPRDGEGAVGGEGRCGGPVEMMVGQIERDYVAADLAAVESLLKLAGDDPLPLMGLESRRDELKAQLESLRTAKEVHASAAILVSGRPVIASRGIESEFGTDEKQFADRGPSAEIDQGRQITGTPTGKPEAPSPADPLDV